MSLHLFSYMLGILKKDIAAFKQFWACIWKQLFHNFKSMCTLMQNM